MKKTFVEYTADICQEHMPGRVLLENKMRLNAFFAELEDVQRRGMRFVFRYVFYSVENLRRITRPYLVKEFGRLPVGVRSVQPEQMTDMEYQNVILYGDSASVEAGKLLAEYLREHDSLKVEMSFFDKREISGSRGKPETAYAELQKALFFCKRKKYPLLFLSIQEMIKDIRFFNLLEEADVDFRCIDFPWFCRENLQLIKAVVLYEKLQIGKTGGYCAKANETFGK